MGYTEEPGKLPALQSRLCGSARQLGLQGQPQDEVRVGRRGEESAGSETTARFPDHGPLPFW